MGYGPIGRLEVRQSFVPSAKKERVAGDPDLVPVYSGRFRITLELVFGAEPQLKPLADPNAEITVKGSFRYQACTAELCFPPQDFPWSGNFRWKALTDGSRFSCAGNEHYRGGKNGPYAKPTPPVKSRRINFRP